MEHDNSCFFVKKARRELFQIHTLPYVLTDDVVVCRGACCRVVLKKDTVSDVTL